MPAAVQRNAIAAFRHRFTLRQTRRTVPIMFSIEGTSKNSASSPNAIKLPANDSASFSFRFIYVHSGAVSDRQWEQFFEVPLNRSESTCLLMTQGFSPLAVPNRRSQRTLRNKGFFTASVPTRTGDERARTCAVNAVHIRALATKGFFGKCRQLGR